MKKALVVSGILAFLLIVALSFLSAEKGPAKLTPLEELGKRLFFDKNLSTPAGQECAACHGADGQGRGKAPALRQAEVYQAPPGALFWILQNGSLLRGMPDV